LLAETDGMLDVPGIGDGMLATADRQTEGTVSLVSEMYFFSTSATWNAQQRI